MRKILVGADLSTEAELAVAHAVDLARREGAEVVLVMVDVVAEAPVGLTPGSDWARHEYHKVLEQRLAADRRGLGELRERWEGQGAAVSQLVVDGFADERLPAIAEETGADLIVVGSHGRTGFKRLIIGSVAERTARLAPCSVLIARGAAPSGGYRRVVVGCDFSPQTRAAIRHAMAAAGTGARLDLIHCWNMSFALQPADGIAPPPTAFYQDLLDGIHAEGARLVAVAKERGDLDVRFAVVERPAVTGLVDHARELDADLIVVGSHGRRGVRRFIMGSVAESTARHAPCSTLIAR